MMMMATATKGKRPLRHLTATDKIDAIQRIHDGESKASVARDIGVPESTLRGWCKNEEKLRYMSRQSVENAEKLSSEATAAALTAAAAAELFSGPPEKRLKLESAMFGGNGKLKYDDSFYKVARGSLNGLDLSGGGGGGGGLDKGGGGLGVSGGDIIMNGLAGASAADFSQFAKTAAEISALSKSKAYGADLGKHHHHGGDPTKSDHHLSMAAISPLTSLSHLSGMSALGQSPLALSFNDIATNLNLIAQLNNNHNLATMSSLAGGLNSAAAAAAAAQSLRSVRPKGSNSAAANSNGTGVGLGSGRSGGGGGGGGGGSLQDTGNSTSGGGAGGTAGGTGGGGAEKSSSSGGNSSSGVPSLTVRNLAKLQQQKSSSGELLGNGMLHQQSHAAGLSTLSEQYRKSSHASNPASSTTPTTTPTNASVGRDPNTAPVDDALWYWLKSQQAMLGLNNLYSSLPRAASHSPPTPPPPMGLTSVTAGAGSPNHAQTLPSTAHTPHTPPPPLVGPPLVSTPQPTPPSSAPSLTPEDTKNSSWFWQWYKTFGASLMPGGTGGGGSGGTGSNSADSKQHLREQQQAQAAQQAAIAAALHHHSTNNNSLSQQNQNNSSGQKGGGGGGSAATAASLTAAYENILYSQLTKGSTTSAVDTLNNNHHHHLNRHLSAHLKGDEPMDLNMSGANEGDAKPEDLSNHHVGGGKDRNGSGGVANGSGDERRSRFQQQQQNPPSRPSSVSSVASSAMSAQGSQDASERMRRQTAPLPDASDAQEDDEEEETPMPLDAENGRKSAAAIMEATSTGGVTEMGEATEIGGLEDEDEPEEEMDREEPNESDPRAPEDEDDEAAAQEQDLFERMSEDAGKQPLRGTKRRRSSSGDLDAKDALDSILFSGNSNDRCSSRGSSAAVSPSTAMLSMVVRGRSVTPDDGAAVVTSGDQNGAEDGLANADEKTGTDRASSLAGDDAKSDTSEEDSSNHQREATLMVASVAVADIRNSADAVEHGEKFLKWLEACSDPNVTAMQVMQFKYLLNSIKLSAERQLQSASASSAVPSVGSEERTRIRKRK
ncbi:protein distal antenna-like [Anopheles nili]|uniref:protein distal antenna-like n=1 Tax=Anopheles nili TaxID=185578 RepID=UPI00237A8E09|nr:protein distal antenna-like [Anopheles nili]